MCENSCAAPMLTFKLIFDVASKGIPPRSFKDLYVARIEAKPFHRYQSMEAIEEPVIRAIKTYLQRGADASWLYLLDVGSNNLLI